MKDEMKCHMCGGVTDFVCRDCDMPVCENCLVEFTYMIQIDYSLCQSCDDYHQAEAYLERDEDLKYEEAIEAKKEKRRAAARTRYWKPENIEKRKLAKKENRKLEAEFRQKQLAETAKILGNIFR